MLPSMLSAALGFLSLLQHHALCAAGVRVYPHVALCAIGISFLSLPRTVLSVLYLVGYRGYHHVSAP